VGQESVEAAAGTPEAEPQPAGEAEGSEVEEVAEPPETRAPAVEQPDEEMAEIEDLIRQSLSADDESVREEGAEPELGDAAEEVVETQAGAEVERFLSDVLGDETDEVIGLQSEQDGVPDAIATEASQEVAGGEPADAGDEDEQSAGVLDEEMEGLLSELLEVEDIEPGAAEEAESPEAKAPGDEARRQQMEEDVRSRVAEESRKMERKLEQTTAAEPPEKQEPPERVEIEAPRVEPQDESAPDDLRPRRRSLPEALEKLVAVLNFPMRFVPVQHRQTFNMAVAFLAAVCIIGSVVIYVMGYLL